MTDCKHLKTLFDSAFQHPLFPTIKNYTKFKISFWKQDCPNPTEAFKNLYPIRPSASIALAISSTLAPVFSYKTKFALIEDICCAKNVLAVSFDYSEDQTLVVIMRSFCNQWARIFTKHYIASNQSSS